MRHIDHQRRIAVTSHRLVPIAGRAAITLALALVCWSVPSTADASCGDWLAGTHAAAGEDATSELNRSARRIGDMPGAVSETPAPDSPSPDPPCRGIRCSGHAPAPPSPATPPTVSVDQWAWLTQRADAPAGGAPAWCDPPGFGRSEQHGPNVFRPPRDVR